MSLLPPDEAPADVPAPASLPVMPVGAPGLPGVRQPVVAMPWERRQPQVQRRAVLPVEFYRRMPGGGTTYAPDVAGSGAGDGSADRG